MPQLAKGGKWVFGWCVVSTDGKIRVPPDASAEYGFQPGEDLILMRGSQTSGGFGLGRPVRLANSPLRSRFIGGAMMGADGCVTLPSETEISPGERLLVVRGSGLALGFLRHGPIYEEAQKHPQIENYEAA